MGTEMAVARMDGRYSLLRPMKERLWMLFVVPLLAGVGAFPFLIRDPQQYRAEGTIVVSTDRPASPGSNAQFIGNFKGAIKSQPVLRKVHRETGVPRAELAKGLDARQIGTSNFIEVSFTGRRPGEAPKVVRAAVRATLQLVFESQLALARQGVEEAQKRLEEGQAAVKAFTQETGLVLPNEEYRQKAAELTQLRVSQEEARAAGNADKAAALERVIAERDRQLAALRPQVQRYQALKEGEDQALLGRSRAEERLREINAQVDVSRAESVVNVSDETPLPRFPYIARRLGIVTAIGLVLAVGLVGLLELLRPAR